MFKKFNRKKTLMAIVAIVVFLSVLLLCFIRQENKEQVQLFQQEEMKKELVETAEYLEQIDSIVLRNHEIIQSLYGSDGQMQTSMDTLDENFVQNMVQQLSPIMKKSEDITVSLKVIQSQITSYLHQYGKDSISQTEYLEQISNHIETLNSKIESTQKTMKDLFKKTEKETGENVEEITAETAKIQKMIDESNEMLEQFYTSLEELENQHINLSKNNQTELLAGIKQLKESMAQNMDSVNVDFLNLTKQMQIELNNMNVHIDVKSEEIQTKLKEIHVGIGLTQADIMILLNAMEENQSNQMEEIKTITIEEIKGAVTKTEQALEETKQQLTNLVEELQVSQDERHAETMSVLTDMEDGIQSAMETHVSESLLSLQGSLDAGNSILKENMTTNFEGLNGALSDTSKLLNEQFGGLTGNLSDNQIKTEQQIIELRKVLLESFDVSNNIFKENMTTNFEGLNGAFSDTSKLMNDQFGGLTGNLSDNQIKTEQLIAELRKFLLESFDASNNILKENMLENFRNLDTEMANQVAIISENMTKQVGTLVDTVNQNGQDIQNSMDVRMNRIDEKLTQVFQSVSSGKELLASAITDKGIKADATESFENLSNKIKLITSGSLSGDIKYTYHVHVAGCNTRCSGTVRKYNTRWHNEHKYYIYDYRCSQCAFKTEHHRTEPGDYRCEVMSLTCGKTTNTIEKAEIVFKSATMANDESIKDFDVWISEIKDGILESKEPNVEEEMMGKNDAENNTKLDINEELEDINNEK